jgi:membrane fusion protein (multidrug efflux system)
VAKDREFRFRVAGGDAPLQGKVLAFEPAVDAQSRSVLVRGIIENKANLLPGAFASVELPIRVEQALLIPAIAVIPGVEGRRVFVVRDGVARGVRVELGARTESRVQVLSGIAAGDQVIVTNLLRVRDGVSVVVRKTAPAAPAPARASSAAPESSR